MTKKPRQKVLSTKDMFKKVDDIDKYSTYVVNEERNEVIKYNKIFSETKIESLIQELFTHIQFDVDNKIGYFTNELKLRAYINFLIIKHFTNLNDILTDSLTENIIIIDKLRAHQLFTLMFSEVFENSEVNRVLSLVNDIAIQADKLLTMKREDLEYLNKQVRTDHYKTKVQALLESMDNFEKNN